MNVQRSLSAQAASAGRQFLRDQRGAVSVMTGVFGFGIVAVVVASVGVAVTFSVTRSHTTDQYVATSVAAHNALVRARAATLYDTSHAVAAGIPASSSWSAPAPAPVASATPAATAYTTTFQNSILAVDASVGANHVPMTMKVAPEGHPPGSTVDSTQ